MDGHVEVGRRRVLIAFEADRNAEERIQIAYRKVQNTSREIHNAQCGVHTPQIAARPHTVTTTETQG